MGRRNRRNQLNIAKVAIWSVLIIALLTVVLVIVIALGDRKNKDNTAGSSDLYVNGTPIDETGNVPGVQGASNDTEGSVESGGASGTLFEESSAASPGQVGTGENDAASKPDDSTSVPPITDPEILWATKDWGLGFGNPGDKPTGVAGIDVMKQYNAFFVTDNEEKVLYLTFDCGYENGNTGVILDVLKKHNVPATFFVVGHYLKTAPDMVKRMVEEGHTVGNHTYSHPDMSTISDEASFRKEMEDVSNLFKEVTGTEMAPYYRPPQGKYCLANLQMAKDLGYYTFFWSIAHMDWDVNNQPSHEKAINTIMNRTHPGAIVLLHVISKTNGEILDDLLTKWEEMGYTFRPLSDFTE